VHHTQGPSKGDPDRHPNKGNPDNPDGPDLIDVSDNNLQPMGGTTTTVSSVEIDTVNMTVNPPRKTVNPITQSPPVSPSSTLDPHGGGMGSGVGGPGSVGGAGAGGNIDGATGSGGPGAGSGSADGIGNAGESTGNEVDQKGLGTLGLSIGFIVGIAAGVVILCFIIAFAFYKYKSRDEGSYKVDESKNYPYEAPVPKPTPTQANGGYKSGTPTPKPKKKDVKEWYV